MTKPNPQHLRARAKMLDDMAALFSEPAAAERSRKIAQRYRDEADAAERAQQQNEEP